MGLSPVLFSVVSVIDTEPYADASNVHTARQSRCMLVLCLYISSMAIPNVISRIHHVCIMTPLTY